MKQEIYFKNQEEWREWLSQNHASSEGVYLILYRVSSSTPSMRWEEAVRIALCYGWIDSTSKRIDDEKRRQLFTPRKTKSVWSQLNKKHIEELIAEGRMQPSGLAKINAAQKDGSWDALNDVDQLIVPKDMMQAFKKNAKAYANYQAFSPSYRKNYLYWLNSAKRQETRDKRIAEIIQLCANNVKSRGAF